MCVLKQHNTRNIPHPPQTLKQRDPDYTKKKQQKRRVATQKRQVPKADMVPLIHPEGSKHVLLPETRLSGSDTNHSHSKGIRGFLKDWCPFPLAIIGVSLAEGTPILVKAEAILKGLPPAKSTAHGLHLVSSGGSFRCSEPFPCAGAKPEPLCSFGRCGSRQNQTTF